MKTCLSRLASKSGKNLKLKFKSPSPIKGKFTVTFRQGFLNSTGGITFFGKEIQVTFNNDSATTYEDPNGPGGVIESSSASPFKSVGGSSHSSKRAEPV